MSTPGSERRRRIASYRKGFEAGHAAALSPAEPVAYLRLGEPEPVLNVPFGAMWISDKDDPRSFPVFAAPQPKAPSVLGGLDLDEISLGAVSLIGSRLFQHNLRLAHGHSQKLPDALTEAEQAKEIAGWQLIIRDALLSLTEAAAPTAKVETTAPASLFPSSGGEATLAPTDQTSFHDSAKTSVSGHDPQALNDDQVDAVLQLIERRLCIIWSQVGAREAFANELRLLEPPAAEDQVLCIACDIPFEDGDMVYWCSDDTGHIHADCCGPERESYVNPDGSPLKDDEPIPQPFAWRA